MMALNTKRAENGRDTDENSTHGPKFDPFDVDSNDPFDVNSHQILSDSNDAVAGPEYTSEGSFENIDVENFKKGISRRMTTFIASLSG